MVKVTGVLVAGVHIGLIVIFQSIGWTSDTYRTFYTIQNLSCGSCLLKIDSKLKGLDGYMGVAANFEKQLIAVDHRTILNASVIEKALNAIGYPVVVCQFDSAQYQILKSESMEWKKPSKSRFRRIIEIFVR